MTGRRRFQILAALSLVCVVPLRAITKSRSEEPRIARISIAPDTITAGQSATLIVELSEPAAAGGFVVGISHITSTGLDDTIVAMPQSLTFEKGATRFPFEIRTRRKTNDPTRIVFTAFHGAERQSANLTVN
jgi:hypothetical protein